MLALLAKIWSGVKAVLRLILPGTFGRMFGRIRGKPDELAGKLVAPKEPTGWGAGFLRVLAVLLVIGILVGLYFIGTLESVRHYIRLPYALQPFFPPVVALLIYGLVWLGWYLLKLLATEEEISAFPDIDAAWSEAMKALDQAGIDVKSAPLFLVIGKPAGSEEALFDASGQRLMVRRAPASVTAPLHVYAGPDAIFVTCAGASLLGNLADILAGVKEPVMDGEMDGSPSIVLGGGTRLPNANFIKMQRILRNAGGRKLSDEERRELGILCARDDARQGHMLDRTKQSLLKDPHKVAEATGRLRRLC